MPRGADENGVNLPGVVWIRPQRIMKGCSASCRLHRQPESRHRWGFPDKDLQQ